MTRAVTHTLPDDVLMAYATGALPEVFDMVVASHVSLCDDARVRLDTFDAIGGAVLDDSAPVDMGPDALAATLAMLSDPVPTPEPRATDPVLPGPVLAALNGDAATLPWRNIGMGSKQAILWAEGTASVRLLSIPPDTAMPDHSHSGMEMTLVLQGAFRDGDDEFHRGDVELADEALSHAPRVISDMPCLCLAAADNRLRFKSWLPRLAQPFLQI